MKTISLLAAVPTASLLAACGGDSASITGTVDVRGAGFIVAPNYAGYDSSKLAYHPYLNVDQESREMIDTLSAASKALSGFLQPVQDSGKLFITGNSQSRHVAMAIHKALQAAGQTVTASAPMSGPYALAAFTDAVFYGNVPLGGMLASPGWPWLAIKK